MGAPDGQQACSIGIDLGTTGIKVVAFDQARQHIAIASRPSNLRRDADGAAELDALSEQVSLLAALAETVEQVHSKGYRVARVGISAAMHSLLAVDASGAPLTGVMTWADLRADADAQALWSSPAGPELYARTGAPIHAMTPLAKLLWMRRVRPDIYQRAARFVGLKEWLWYQWFGEWVIDASLASATGLYNLQERRWDTGALSLTGVDPTRLSRVVSTAYVHAGPIPAPFRAAGVDDDCALVIGASDGALANLGVHLLDDQRLVVTIGTSLAVRLGSSAVVTDPRTRAFCYVLSEEQSHYLLGQPSNCGGSVLQWVYQQGVGAFASAQGDSTAHAALSFEDALTAAGADAVAAHASELFFLPYINGERAPLWTSRASGAFVGLRAEHTAVDALRAAAEGILLNAAWIAEPFVKRPHAPEAIIASGGALQSPWMRQLLADIFGLPVYEVETIEASACGAALIADLACGAATWQQASTPLAPTTISTPSPTTHATYQAKLERFRSLAVTLNTSR